MGDLDAFAEVQHNRGRSAMSSLDNSGASGIRKVQEARKARALCKKAWLTAKVRPTTAMWAVLTFIQGASDRALDLVLGPLGEADPPGMTGLVALCVI